MANISTTLPSPGTPLIDPATGQISQTWWYFFQTQLTRTGGTVGVDSASVQTSANAANAAAAAAQASATAAAGAVASETTRAEAAEALLAPKVSPSLTGIPTAPTASPGTSTTQLATTAFTTHAISAAAYTLPTATTSVLGGVKIDGTTVTILSGVISAAAPATVAPLIDGTAAVGTSALYARQDHVHPTDTTRAPMASPTFTGIVTAPEYVVGSGGPTWTTGSAAPTSTQPVGSLYSRTGGAVGSTLYVSRGAGTWNAVAGV